MKDYIIRCLCNPEPLTIIILVISAIIGILGVLSIFVKHKVGDGLFFIVLSIFLIIFGVSISIPPLFGLFIIFSIIYTIIFGILALICSIYSN